MNQLEKQMVFLLADLKTQHHVLAVKAEFEAEGARTEEVMRLQTLALRAGLELTLKIGGCEALRDLHEASILGVRHVVAPMVETPYALSKFLKAIPRAFPEGEDVDFWINIETLTACREFQSMLAEGGIEKLRGIVIGRADLAGSMGLDRSSVNDQAILDWTRLVALQAQAQGLKVIVGGAVSLRSLPFFNSLKDELDGFETRKVVFDAAALVQGVEALQKALAFETLWLENKRQHYGRLHHEEDERLLMLAGLQRLPVDALG